VGDGEVRVPIPGADWTVAVDPTGSKVVGQFRKTFGLGAAAVILVGCFVVGLVWQSERLARQRSRFAASAAHELRTPLAGLRMYGEMLADGLGDPGKSKDYARRVADEAERLGRVVSNVLGFSRLERGALRVRPEPGDLGAAVRECVERQHPALEALGASVDLSVEDGIPPARFDRDAVAQILQNLLDNAEKYARGASDRSIRVTLRQIPDSGSRIPDAPTGGLKQVELAVEDRGPGISSEIGARLFQPFARGGGTDAPAGLGLGLAIARALARAQGGSLKHAPAEGGGARFVVTLPI
jgi:signal transduction histidine kinase